MRVAGADDWGFIAELGRRSLDASGSALRPAPMAGLAASFDRLFEFVRRSAHFGLLAQSDFDGPLGFALALTDLPDEVSGLPQAFLAYMAVEAHAQHRGIGTRLLAATEAEARARGLPALALMVTEDNLAARALYARAGFATERRLLCKPL
ncbi:MAG: GNAT family N-acetyltransferase [Vulcanimicrobiaceae bacterium]